MPTKNLSEFSTIRRLEGWRSALESAPFYWEVDLAVGLPVSVVICVWNWVSFGRWDSVLSVAGLSAGSLGATIMLFGAYPTRRRVQQEMIHEQGDSRYALLPGARPSMLWGFFLLALAFLLQLVAAWMSAAAAVAGR